MISICMCTYNSSKYLLPQLESLKNQTYKDFEVIICDDNSSDNTLDILSKFIKENNLNSWKVYQNENNLGYQKNFAKSLSLARGEIITLCDHDDVWHEDKLDRINEFFKNEKIDFVGTSFEEIDQSGNIITNKYPSFTSNNGKIKYRIKKRKKLSFKKIFTYSMTPGCCMAFRHKNVDDIIKLINIAPHDYVISCYFANKNKCLFVNEKLISYRIHDSNQIGLPDLNCLEDRIKICDKDILEKEDILSNLQGILKKSDTKYAKKHIKLVKARKEGLLRKSIKLSLLIKSFFQKRYYFTILKDMKVLKK